MAVVTTIGERTYEFETMIDASAAAELFQTKWPDDQNQFEELMENANIEFYIEA